jgi:plastocyanin
LAVSNPPAGASDYRWDLSGQDRFPLDTGSVGQTAAVLTSPGAHTVAVRVTTPTGIEIGRLAVTVLSRPVSGSPAPSGGERHRTPRAPIRSIAPAPVRRAGTQAERHGPPLAHRVLAHAAGDPGVTISDFKFTPGATTVHVGDTITWTNDGPSPHSATANNGSFDTGLLSKGQSGSHTFTQAGTFTYFCKIHPFMHGTVVVLASSTATSPTTTPSSATPASASTTPTGPTSPTAAVESTVPQLPMTGMNLGGALFAGLLLLGLGLALRVTRPR